MTVDRANVPLPRGHPLAAWVPAAEPDCIADVPLELKRELEAWYAVQVEGVTVSLELPAAAPLVAAADFQAQGLVDPADAPHGLEHRLLPEWQSQALLTATTIIDHTIVGEAPGAWAYFHDRTGIESHFIIAGRWSPVPDGRIWQLMSYRRRADANLEANAYAISIETGDDGTPEDTGWTPAQQESLVWLHDYLARMLGIRRQRSTSCTSGGLGHHTLHGAPSCWTPVAKSCPAATRKRQWEDVLLPAFLEGSAAMAWTETEWTRLRTELERSTVRGVRWDDHGDPEVQGAGNHHARIRADVSALAAKVDALAATVSQPAPVQVDPATLAAALADPALLEAIAGAVAGRTVRTAGERLLAEPPVTPPPGG